MPGISNVTLLLLVFSLPLLAAEAPDGLTFESLHKSGIVSGFGMRDGNPLNMKGRIPAIDHPIYVPAKAGLYPGRQRCIGIQIDGGNVLVGCPAPGRSDETHCWSLPQCPDLLPEPVRFLLPVWCR
jgi:hypothetical protein